MQKKVNQEFRSLKNHRRCYEIEDFLDSCKLIANFTHLNFTTETYIRMCMSDIWSHYPPIVDLLNSYLKFSTSQVMQTTVRVKHTQKSANILNISKYGLRKFCFFFMSNIRNLGIEFSTPSKVLRRRRYLAKKKLERAGVKDFIKSATVDKGIVSDSKSVDKEDAECWEVVNDPNGKVNNGDTNESHAPDCSDKDQLQDNTSVDNIDRQGDLKDGDNIVLVEDKSVYDGVIKKECTTTKNDDSIKLERPVEQKSFDNNITPPAGDNFSGSEVLIPAMSPTMPKYIDVKSDSEDKNSVAKDQDNVVTGAVAEKENHDCHDSTPDNAGSAYVLTSAFNSLNPTSFIIVDLDDLDYSLSESGFSTPSYYEVASEDCFC